MDITSILIGLALLALVAFGVGYPFIERRGLREEHATTAESLLAEREAVLAALRDLDFDQTVGKVLPEDYAAQRAELVARGVTVLKQMDALGIPNAETSADEAIEQAVARRRQTANAHACAQCHAPASERDRFCSHCGASLPKVAA